MFNNECNFPWNLRKLVESFSSSGVGKTVPDMKEVCFTFLG